MDADGGAKHLRHWRYRRRHAAIGARWIDAGYGRRRENRWKICQTGEAQPDSGGDLLRAANRQRGTDRGSCQGTGFKHQGR